MTRTSQSDAAGTLEYSPGNRAAQSPPSMPARLAKVARLVMLVLLICAIFAATWFFFRTEQGYGFVHDPEQRRHLGEQARQWVHYHRFVAPLAYVAVYVALVLLLLPIWWVQVLAGVAFGFFGGLLWSQVAATVAAVCIMLLSRWLAADWFHNRVETRLDKLRDLDEKLGHNGFLVVMGVRLVHFMPFGASNYLFGITRIPVVDVALGTFLGGIPSTAFYMAIGSGMHPFRNLRFMAMLVLLNILLLVPVVMRYLRPDWFKKIGVE